MAGLRGYRLYIAKLFIFRDIFSSKNGGDTTFVQQARLSTDDTVQVTTFKKKKKYGTSNDIVKLYCCLFKEKTEGILSRASECCAPYYYISSLEGRKQSNIIYLYMEYVCMYVCMYLLNCT